METQFYVVFLKYIFPFFPQYVTYVTFLLLARPQLTNHVGIKGFHKPTSASADDFHTHVIPYKIPVNSNTKSSSLTLTSTYFPGLKNSHPFSKEPKYIF